MSIRIDRVYTKAGDQGETGLAGGHRVSKGDLRIEAYGTVDELNSWVGLCRAHVGVMAGPKELAKELEAEFALIQQDLFDVGAELATPAHKGKEIRSKLGESRIEELEKAMDRWQEQLEPLTSFILPGGGLLSSHLHLARTVCRRAERYVVRLIEKEKIQTPTLKYLNRLSDTFFVLSRYVAKRLGEKEILWKY